MQDFLAFRKFITPLFIQIIFWIGVAVYVIGGIVTISQGGSAALMGVLIILIGPIFWRIWCELLMVIFQIYGELVKIRAHTEGAPPPVSGFPVIPAAPL